MLDFVMRWVYKLICFLSVNYTKVYEIGIGYVHFLVLNAAIY